MMGLYHTQLLEPLYLYLLGQASNAKSGIEHTEAELEGHLSPLSERKLSLGK